MVHAGWFIDSFWWCLALGLPSLTFCLPIGSERKERLS